MVDYLRDSLKDALMELLKDLFMEGKIEVSLSTNGKSIMVVVDGEIVQAR